MFFKKVVLKSKYSLRDFSKTVIWTLTYSFRDFLRLVLRSKYSYHDVLRPRYGSQSILTVISIYRGMHGMEVKVFLSWFFSRPRYGDQSILTVIFKAFVWKSKYSYRDFLRRWYRSQNILTMIFEDGGMKVDLFLPWFFKTVVWKSKYSSVAWWCLMSLYRDCPGPLIFCSVQCTKAFPLAKTRIAVIQRKLNI